MGNTQIVEHRELYKARSTNKIIVKTLNFTYLSYPSYLKQYDTCISVLCALKFSLMFVCIHEDMVHFNGSGQMCSRASRAFETYVSLGLLISQVYSLDFCCIK